MNKFLKFITLGSNKVAVLTSSRHFFFLKNESVRGNTSSSYLGNSSSNEQHLLQNKQHPYFNLGKGIHKIHTENKVKKDGDQEEIEKEQQLLTQKQEKKGFTNRYEKRKERRGREIENGFLSKSKRWNVTEKEKNRRGEKGSEHESDDSESSGNIYENNNDNTNYANKNNEEELKETEEYAEQEVEGEDTKNFHKRHKFRSEPDRYDELGKNLKNIEWSKIKIKIERENLYNNENYKKNIKKISEEELQNELKKNDIRVDQNLPMNNLITSFSDIVFPESILNYLTSKFKEPTPIQKITWPIALSGKDLIGVAETGSGKTLAYVLPALMHIQRHREKMNELEKSKGELKRSISEEKEAAIVVDIKEEKKEKIEDGNGDGNEIENSVEIADVRALVVLPTRELCIQVVNEIKVFENIMNIKSAAIYGGVPKHYQIERLKKGVDIIVCTPGRLLDFLESGLLNLLKCIYVVIDEADRLLDMGFEKQLRNIMSQINKNKQLLFLTATWPEQVKQLAYDFCSYNPIKIQIGESTLTANKNIEQNVVVCSSMDLRKKLLEYLKENYEDNKILIFCATKRNCDNLCKELRYHQYNALSIHGDKQQRERDRILNNYKTDKCNILVATDVASRGLDIKNISIVINFDIPNTIEDYIHRIGRTGRAGNKGKSILLFSYDYFVPQKMKFAKELVKQLNKANQKVPSELKEIAYSR